jgi:GntR family transcriptional regulator
MYWTVDPSAAVPVSEQIAEQIRFAIAAGRLSAGDRLPSVRALARDLLVNPNTVAKVYRDLERDGILRTRPGSGAFVASGAARRCRRESERAVNQAVRGAVDKGRAAGIAPEEIREIVDDCLSEEKAESHAS